MNLPIIFIADGRSGARRLPSPSGLRSIDIGSVRASVKRMLLIAHEKVPKLGENKNVRPNI
jgi:hypothetical protein